MLSASSNYEDKLSMVLIRWQSFPEIETLRQQMDRMLDEMAGLKHEQQTTRQQAVKSKNTEDSVILRIEFQVLKLKT